MDIIHERVQSDALQLPVFHHVALKLLGLLSKDDFNITQVAHLITEDQTLTSQVLRVANSSFFAGLSQVATIRDAIVRLGVRQVTNVVTLVTQSNQYRSSNKIMGGYMHDLWKHALGCALGTKWLADKAGYKELSNEGMLAGLLHDIGELFLLKLLEDIHTSEPHEFHLSKAVLLEVLQDMHVEQGYLLMRQWNIPEIYCNIVRSHHLESYDTNDVLLMMVRLVDQACEKNGIGVHHDPSIVLAATSEAQHLGIKEVLLAELEIMLEDAVALSH
jgi:HD-like signal output (HDOD) protein